MALDLMSADYDVTGLENYASPVSLGDPCRIKLIILNISVTGKRGLNEFQQT